MLKISKNGYLKGFCLAVIALGVIRAVFPKVAMTADVGRRFARKGCGEIQIMNNQKLQ